jgi:hypothetical protein
MAHPRDYTYGRIVAQGLNYQITAEDVAWMAVSIAHEDSTYGNNFSVYIRQFSQPVNPAWAFETDLNMVRRLRGSTAVARNRQARCQRIARARGAGWGIHERNNPCYAGRQTNRIRNIATALDIVRGDESAWAEVLSNSRECAVQICQGRVGNPIPGYSNFANDRPQQQAIARGGGREGVLNTDHGRVRLIRRGGGWNEEINDYNHERANIFYFLPPNGPPVTIVGPEARSDRSPNRRFPRGTGGTTARRTRRAIRVDGIDLSTVSSSNPQADVVSTSVAGSSGSSRSVSVPPGQSVSGASPQTLDSYRVASGEELNRQLETWADGIEDTLSRIAPY